MYSMSQTYNDLIFCSVGGTVGAIVTCPLEVIKTRLQSSIPVFRPAVACLSGTGTVTFSYSVEKVPAGILACTKYVLAVFTSY